MVVFQRARREGQPPQLGAKAYKGDFSVASVAQFVQRVAAGEVDMTELKKPPTVSPISAPTRRRKAKEKEEEERSKLKTPRMNEEDDDDDDDDDDGGDDEGDNKHEESRSRRQKKIKKKVLKQK